MFFFQCGKFWFDMCISLGWYLCKLPTMKGLPIITRPAFNQIDNQNVGSLYQKNCKEQWNLTQLIILLQFLTKVKKKLLFFDRICVSFLFLVNGQSWVWSTSILNYLTCGGGGSQRGNFFLWLDLCENYPPLSRQCELWYVSSFPMLSSLFWCEYISGKMNKCLLNICRLDWFPTSVQKGCCEFNLCQGSHPLPCTLQMKMFNETFYQF